MRQAEWRENAHKHAINRVAQRFSAGPDLLRAIKREFKRDGRKRKVSRDGFAYTRQDGAQFFPIRKIGIHRLRAVVVIDGAFYDAVYDYRLKTVVTVLPSTRGAAS